MRKKQWPVVLLRSRYSDSDGQYRVQIVEQAPRKDEYCIAASNGVELRRVAQPEWRHSTYSRTLYCRGSYTGMNLMVIRVPKSDMPKLTAAICELGGKVYIGRQVKTQRDWRTYKKLLDSVSSARVQVPKDKAVMADDASEVPEPPMSEDTLRDMLQTVLIVTTGNKLKLERRAELIRDLLVELGSP